MKLFIDLSPLKISRSFAGLWGAGVLTSVTGQMIQMALAWQVFSATASSLAVGAIGLAVALPTLIFGLLGGALTDLRPPKIVGLVGTSGQILTSVVFLILTLTHSLAPPIIYALIAVQSAFGAITAPTRRPYLRKLLPSTAMPAAMALYMLSMHTGQIVGPVISGLLLNHNLLALIFMMHIMALGGYLGSVLALPAIPAAAPGVVGFGSIRSGLAGMWQHNTLRKAILVDFSMTFFALPIALLPAFNAERLDGGPLGYGWLLSAVSIGGVVGTLASGWLGTLQKPLACVFWFASAWSLAVGVLAFTSTVWGAILILGIMGILDVWSLTLQQSVVQRETPTTLLGRMGSIQSLAGMAGPQLGNFRAGAMGSVIGVQQAIALGAVMGLIAIAILSRSRSDSPVRNRNTEGSAER